MFSMLATALLAVAAVAAAQEPVVPADARAAIEAANSAWLKALQAHDAVTIAAPYAEDGIFVTATGAVFKGRDAVAQMMRERFARTGKVANGELVQDGLTRQGSFIYEWGHARLEVVNEGAAPVQSVARYLTVWRKNAAGRWEIVRNMSLPD